MRYLIAALIFIIGCATIGDYSKLAWQWPPDQREVDRIIKEETAKYDIGLPYIHVIFTDHEWWAAAICVKPNPIILIKPMVNWRENLRHELKHIYLWLKTGDGNFAHF